MLIMKIKEKKNMENDLGRIDVCKDTMLFVTNELFGENIKKQQKKKF